VYDGSECQNILLVVTDVGREFLRVHAASSFISVSWFLYILSCQISCDECNNIN